MAHVPPGHLPRARAGPHHRLRPFARALGEYGSVVFVAGNKRFETEIATILIVENLDEGNYSQATAIAVVLLAISFVMLILINLLERWSKRHES